MKLIRRKDVRPPGEATASRERAERELAEARAETPKYVELGRSLRHIERENGLTEAMLDILLHGRG